MIIDNNMAAINSEIQTSPRDFSESVVAEIDPVQKRLNGIRDDPWKVKWASIYSGLLVRHFQMACEKGQENAANSPALVCAISWAGGIASGPSCESTGGANRDCTTSRAFLNG
jgi:hypothetical protein